MTKKGVSVSQSVTTTTKKGATHPRFFEKHICNGASAMCSHSSSCSSCSLFFLATSLHQTWHPVCPHQGLTGDSCPSKEEANFMHTMRTSGKRCYKVVNVSARFMQINLFAPDLAPSLSTPWAHWRQLPIKGRGQFHAYDVHLRKTMLQSCRCMALHAKATSLHQTWHPTCPHQGHTGDSKSSLAEAYFMCTACAQLVDLKDGSSDTCTLQT